MIVNVVPGIGGFGITPAPTGITVTLQGEPIRVYRILHSSRDPAVSMPGRSFVIRLTGLLTLG